MALILTVSILMHTHDVIDDILLKHSYFLSHFSNSSCNIDVSSTSENYNFVTRNVIVSSNSIITNSIRDNNKSELRYKKMPHEIINIKHDGMYHRVIKASDSSSYKLVYTGADKSVVSDDESVLRQTLFAPWSLRNRTLKEWIANRSFSISDISSKGKDVIATVKYINMDITKDEEDVSFVGSVTISPDKYYAIIDVDLVLTFRFENGANKSRRYTRKISFGKHQDKPDDYVVEHDYLVSNDMPYRTYFRWIVSGLIQRDYNSKDYSLSKYGIIDIGSQGNTVIPWSIYFSVAGFIFLIAAIVIMSRRSRKIL